MITPSVDHLQASEHNGAPITIGDDWIGQIASDLMHSTEWHSSALFITWDDCGWFHDQAQPGINPDGTQQGPRLHLPPLGPNDARAYGYTNAFDYTQQPISPIPTVNRPVPRGADTDWAQLRQDT